LCIWAGRFALHGKSFVFSSDKESQLRSLRFGKLQIGYIADSEVRHLVPALDIISHL
jgi:hypothetical protein